MKPRELARAWKPPYTTQVYSQATKSQTDVAYTVDDARSLECPVSAITQKSADLVYLITGMEKLKEYAGVTAGLAEISGSTADAIRLVSNESNSIEAARMEAEQRASHN